MATKEGTLVPDEDLLISASEELNDAFREPDDPELDPEVSDPPLLPLGRSWHFDFVKRRFVKYGRGVAQTHGLESLKMWIQHTLLIGRYSSPIFPATYGMDDPFLMVSEPDSPELRVAYREQVITALMEHDRILAVDEFEFLKETEDDAMYVEFTVLLADDERLPMRIPVNG